MFQPPAWMTQPGESLVVAAAPALPHPQSPLFGRLSQRGLLSSALGTLAPEGEIDVDAIIAIECEDPPLNRLPRISVPSLRRGTKVLLDHSAGMDPFAPDQALLLHQLDNILADDRLEILHFVGCPGRGVGAGPRRTWRAWTPPPAGTPVLAVTDFGIGGPMLDEERATTAEWVRFACQGTRRRLPVAGARAL